MAGRVPDQLLERVQPDWMLGYLGSSKCSLQGAGSSVRVEVDFQGSGNVAERARAVAGGVGRVHGGF